MNTIFKNFKNSKTSDPHKLLLDLTDKIDLNLHLTFTLTSQHLLYVEKHKKSYTNNKLKISALTWNEKFELADGSYSISYIQDYFEYILKKHGEKLLILQLEYT